MSNDFLKEYKQLTLRGANNRREKLRNRAKFTFEKSLNILPTAIDIQVTDIDEVTITEKTKTVRAIINNISDNDQTALDEKEIYLSTDVNVDIGCYCYFDNCYWLFVFKEHKEMGAYKHFVIKKCNQILKYKYKGIIYEIPLSIQNLTMYSDGIKDNRYISYGDAKRFLFYGSNPITRTLGVGSRVMITRNTVFRITHINDFEYNGRFTGADGLIKSLVLQTLLISEDDTDNKIAFNIEEKSNEIKDKNKIQGDKYIYLGEKNKYSIEYDGEIEFSFDYFYNDIAIIKQENNSCVIEQANSFNLVGENVMLIAKDKKTNETIDMLVITIRGV